MIHVVGPEVMGRVEFAHAIAAAFGYDGRLIVPRSTAELNQGAPRPLYGGLLTNRLAAAHPGTMRPLSEVLQDFRGILTDPGFGSWVQPVPGFPA